MRGLGSAKKSDTLLGGAIIHPHIAPSHATEGRTGVLIFVSLVERYCEIVADLAIASKVDNAHWQSVVGEMLPLLRRKQQAEALISLR